MKSKKYISVLLNESISNEAGRTVFPSIDNVRKKIVSIETDVVRKGLDEFIESFTSIIDKVSFKHRQFEINEIEVSLSIDAGGKIHILGEISSNVNSSLKIRFKKIREE